MYFIIPIMNILFTITKLAARVLKISKHTVNK